MRLTAVPALCHGQVVYPALDSKVRNVTLAYSVEHEDEVGGWPAPLHLVL